MEKSKHKYTILTPTYNRERTIGRLYESLKRQVFKDFLWLIVDDGSQDRTKQLIEQYIKEGVLDIEYHYKENGGKHTTLLYASKLLQSDYVVIIDDDDEATNDCLAVFDDTWKKIIDEGRNDIGAIRALSVDMNGHVSGNYSPPMDSSYIDSNYIEMEWVRGKHLENITCWNSETFRIPSLFDDSGKWLYDKVKAVYETVFWNRIARQYNTRYIFTPLRIYYTDSMDGLTNSKFNEQKCYNHVFTKYVQLNEQCEYNWKNPFHLLKMLGEYMACAIALRLPMVDVLRALDSRLNQITAFFFFIPSYFVSMRLRKDFDK